MISVCVCACGLSHEGPVQPQSEDDDDEAGHGQRRIRWRCVLSDGRVVEGDLHCFIGYISFCESWKREKEGDNEREQQQYSHMSDTVSHCRGNSSSSGSEIDSQSETNLRNGVLMCVTRLHFSITLKTSHPVLPLPRIPLYCWLQHSLTWSCLNEKFCSSVISLFFSLQSPCPCLPCPLHSSLSLSLIFVCLSLVFTLLKSLQPCVSSLYRAFSHDGNL